MLQEPLSLIQGPPGKYEVMSELIPKVRKLTLSSDAGTGKNSCICYLSLLHGTTKFKDGKKDGIKRQILVSAPSNVAVDQLVEKLHKASLNVVKISGEGQRRRCFYRRFLVLAQYGTCCKPQRCQTAAIEKEAGDLTKQDYSKLYRERRRTELDILNLADVICCTCVGAGDPRLLERSMKRVKKRRRFEQVLIDEATQGIEPETMIPIVTGAKQLVMVGDHQQLPPVVCCKGAAKAGLGQSLFERLVLRGQNANRLDNTISDAPMSICFPIEFILRWRIAKRCWR